MILIGTSGSTKCNWQLIKREDDVINFTSKGINPFFHNKNIIADNIKDIKEIIDHLEDIDVVFFYGAGCSSVELKNIVNRGLSTVFQRSNIYINHDIVAAAFATYQGVPNFTALIGSGANSCYFDGDRVKQEIPGINYVLGDEGSGSYFGKILLKDFLYGKLPNDIRTKFDSKFGLDTHSILENIYMKPYANIYLASFMPFIEENKSHPYFSEMVKEGLSLYLDLFICSFKNYKKYKTHFVGSIPYYFQDILIAVAEEKEIIIGDIIKEPLERLVKYYTNRYYIKRNERSNARY